VTDGSLAETREQLLGHHIIEVKRLAAGDRHRHADPGGPTGGVEIRPLAAPGAGSRQVNAVRW
jgi:hypothetical protein